MSSEIAKQLEILYQNSKPIRLLNVYKGIPISYDGMMINQTLNAFELSVAKFQIVCLRTDRQTYLQSPLLSSVIKANVFSTNINGCTCILKDFQYASNSIGQRNLIRAQPEQPIDVILLNENKTERTKTQLIDISLSGMALLASPLLFNPNIFRMRSKVVVQFDLPDSTAGRLNPIKINGILMNQIPDNRQNQFRVGLRLYPDETNKPLISKYITQRQSEVLRDIKDMYDVLARNEAAQSKR